MKDDFYELQYLIDTFTEHEKEFEDSRKKQIIQFQIDFPEKYVPDHYVNDFLLCKALKTLAHEILTIKNGKKNDKKLAHPEK